MNQSPTEVTAAAVRVELARHQIRPSAIAKLLGRAPSTISRRLAGEYPFRVDELVAIAEHIGVPLSVLLPTEERAA